MTTQAQLIDPDGNDLVTEVLTQLDRLEFLANKSKAKDREQQTLRALKSLRDYLITCGLNDFKLNAPNSKRESIQPVVEDYDRPEDDPNSRHYSGD